MSEPTLPTPTVMDHHFDTQAALDAAHELYQDWVSGHATGAEVHNAYMNALLGATRAAGRFSRDRRDAEDMRERLADLDTAWGEDR